MNLSMIAPRFAILEKKMKFEKTKTELVIILETDAEKQSLQDFQDSGEIQTDNVLYDYFENFISNSEYEWGSAEEIGALTSAPILVSRDRNDNVIEAYGFMDYCLRSPLQELLEYGKVKFQKG